MFCDELQCSDRASYGQNSRGSIYAFDFDMNFENELKLTYFFDKAYEDEVVTSKAYKDMLHTGYTKKSGAVRINRSKFVDDIDEIVEVKDLIPSFEPDVKKEDAKCCIEVKLEEKKKRTGKYLSDDNYLNLYRFAIALHGRYVGATTESEMQEAFETQLSLEYKLSNIAQAKSFDRQLNGIKCFYTDKAVDYEPVRDFRALT